LEIFHGLDETTGKDVFEYGDWLQERVMEAIAGALRRASRRGSRSRKPRPPSA
jgi:hypothetical protein